MKGNKLLRQPFVMYSFLAIQVLVFLFIELVYFRQGGSANSDILLYYGAMKRETVITYHQWWRFVTPIFLHIGWSHFALNSLFLFYMGRQTEALFGHFRFFLLYLLSGIAGNALSFALQSNQTISAGASTALFGMLASYITIPKTHRNYPYIRSLIQSYSILLVINLLVGLFQPEIDLYGHLGGVIGGFLVGKAISLPNMEDDQVNIHSRIISGMLFVFFFVICILIGLRREGIV